MTIQHGRDDASVEVAQSVVVLGPRSKAGDHPTLRGKAAQPKTLRVGRPATEAAQGWKQPLMDAQLSGAFIDSPRFAHSMILASRRRAESRRALTLRRSTVAS